jgi:hypothetical protein
MSKQRIGYILVSTFDQCTERQLAGIALDKVFTDKASGKDTKSSQKGPKKAPALGCA